MILAEESAKGDEHEEGDEAEEVTQTGTLVALSMQSIVGFTKGKSMKLKGIVKVKEVLIVILIDSGALHNFIVTAVLERLVLERLGLSSEKTRPYHVTVGDGYKIKGSGICRGVTVDLQGFLVKQDFYVFDLGGADMVLGYEWLDSLGETLVIWCRQTIKIKSGGKEICLRGDPSLTKTLISLKSLL